MALVGEREHAMHLDDLRHDLAQCNPAPDQTLLLEGAEIQRPLHSINGPGGVIALIVAITASD